MVKYRIFVKTGNEYGHFTESKVYIILHGNNSQTEPFDLRTINSNAFHVGNEHTFLVESTTILDKVQRIELWRDGNDSINWYVDCITITNVVKDAQFLFVVQEWTVDKVHYIVHHRDACLPQNDPSLALRQKKLLTMRNEYKLKVQTEGLPAQVADLPNDETFSFLDQVKFATSLLVYTSEKGKLLKKNNSSWESFEDVNTVYSRLFGRPQGSLLTNNDASFGRQRLNGLNSSLLERCFHIPEKFRVTEDMIKQSLQGHTLQWTINSARLFIIDLKILENCPTMPGCLMTCPIALFYFNDEGSLMPIAIQLFQNEKNNPVFLPTDPTYTWMAAKMWYNLADSTYHQAITHLNFTHLMMEGISVASYRNLSPKHPIMKLLKPHFKHLMAINSLSLSTLIKPEGIIDTTSNAGILGHFHIMKKSMEFWSLDSHGTLPADLSRRGVREPEVLNGAYHMRDDGLLLYNAIKNYVLSYVRLYYANDTELDRDEEIQNWKTELVTVRDDGGVGILGVPGGGKKFEERNHLVGTLTAIIYQCSAGHAAANFQQYDEYGAPFNYPYYLYGQPPRNKKPLDVQAILGSIAKRERLLETMSIAKILSAKPTKGLGEFDVNSFVDPQAIPIVQRFREELVDVGKKIDENNKRREHPYKWLHPRAVPNSIEI